MVHFSKYLSIINNRIHACEGNRIFLKSNHITVCLADVKDTPVKQMQVAKNIFCCSFYFFCNLAHILYHKKALLSLAQNKSQWQSMIGGKKHEKCEGNSRAWGDGK